LRIVVLGGGGAVGVVVRVVLMGTSTGVDGLFGTDISGPNELPPIICFGPNGIGSIGLKGCGVGVAMGVHVQRLSLTAFLRSPKGTRPSLNEGVLAGACNP